MRQRAAAAGLGERAAFLGLVSGVEKLSVYQAADLFVLPTSQENFGFVFPEALACGVPVVTTKGVDTWPELEGSGGAMIVPAEAAAMAEAIRQLLADPDRCRRMGAKGREWVLREFGGTAVVERYEALYADAAGLGPKDGRG
jgi:glycosyltransferase involved in cell wall biosynthesis